MSPDHRSAVSASPSVENRAGNVENHVENRGLRHVENRHRTGIRPRTSCTPLYPLEADAGHGGPLSLLYGLGEARGVDAIAPTPRMARNADLAGSSRLPPPGRLTDEPPLTHARAVDASAFLSRGAHGGSRGPVRLFASRSPSRSSLSFRWPRSGNLGAEPGRSEGLSGVLTVPAAPRLPFQTRHSSDRRKCPRHSAILETQADRRFHAGAAVMCPLPAGLKGPIHV